MGTRHSAPEERTLISETSSVDPASANAREPATLIDGGLRGGLRPPAAGTANTAAQAAAPATEDLPPGATIDRYLVLSRLGAGGMGVVYAAYDPELGRNIAIKLLRSASDSAGDPEGRVRLLREAQAMARLSHPNVILVFDVGTAFEQVFVAMEFCDGGTLSDWLKQPHSQEEILAMFAMAGRGLSAAHAAGLVHRGRMQSTSPTGRLVNACLE
jgi:hypothetical protein